jgi:hypothetical protein
LAGFVVAQAAQAALTAPSAPYVVNAREKSENVSVPE